MLGKALLLLLGSIATVTAQPPAILQEGIRNEASRIPPSLPGGALAPGSRVRVDGLRISDSPKVRLRSGEREWTPVALEASPQHAIFQVPYDLPPGPAALTLTNKDGESRPYAVHVSSANGGLYSLNRSGWGPARATRLTPTGPESIDLLHPAHPGDTVMLQATGSAQDAQISVGGINVAARWSPNEEGLATVSFSLSEAVPVGCYVPVHLHYRKGLSGNTVTIPVSTRGQSCRSFTLWPSLDTKGSNLLALLLIARINLRIGFPGQAEVQFTDEEAAFHFFSPLANPQPLEVLPPPGTCVTYHGLAQQDFGARKNLLEMLQSRLPGPALNAGPRVVLQGPAGARTIPRNVDSGDYFAFLGGERPDYSRAVQPLFLSPGRYRAKSDGTETLGAFETEFQVPRELRSRSLARLDSVTRRQGLQLQWSDGPKDAPVYLLAVSVRHSTTAFGAFLCTAPPGSSKFSVPPSMLANFPATEPETTLPLNLVFLIAAPELTRFNATGIDAGFILPFTLTGRTVDFR